MKNYDGGDIELNPNMISSPRMFPELLEHKGEDLIVTDGTTLLGADDKQVLLRSFRQCVSFVIITK